MVEIGVGEGALPRELLPILGRPEVVDLARDLIPRLATACDDLGELPIYSPAGLIALEDSALLLHSLLSNVNNSALDICLY
jgi:16S rRNA A1518/A1519 N6-dimethyltransferase RsmA/KsgA/DIM1 with predicted DNA glycosylase/AP lyase activity